MKCAEPEAVFGAIWQQFNRKTAIEIAAKERRERKRRNLHNVSRALFLIRWGNLMPDDEYHYRLVFAHLEFFRGYFNCRIQFQSGVFFARDITAYLLFDSSDQLKDVMIRKWTDGI